MEQGWKKLTAFWGNPLTQEVMTYVGLCLGNFPSGCFLYFGNLLTYTDSYQRAVLSDRTVTNTTSLMACVYTISWITTLIMADKVLERFPSTRMAFIVSILLLDVAFFVSHWTLQQSTILLVVVLGVMSGISVGASLAATLRICIDWSRGRKFGMITSFTTNSFIGYMAISALITAYTNPHNLPPESQEGNLNYFDQPDVLDRVPSLFFVLSGCFICFHTVGALLLRIPPLEGREALRLPQNDQVNKSSKCNTDTDNEKSNLMKKDCDSSNENPVKFKSQNETSIAEHGNTLSYDSLEQTCSGFEKGAEGKDQVSDTSKTKQEKATPSKLRSRQQLWKLLKNSTFLTLCLTGASGDFSLICLTAFYKTFGQTYIQNDHFLALVGVSLSVSIGLSRIAWGIVSDKYGVKATILSVTGVSTCIPVFWYVSAMTDQWFYLVTSSVMASSAVGMYNIMPLAVYKCFGEGNVNFMFGLVLIPNILTAVTFPALTSYILAQAGWFGIFCVAGIVNGVGMAACAVFCPNNV